MNLDAIRQRAVNTQEWIDRDPCNADGFRPLSVREHFKHDVPDLLDRVELLQAEVVRERGKVGDLVRKLDDITRGQGEVWPAGASLPAGPPLPRRVPGESLKPCGWMGIEPMTDPALDDRTEGSES